jgi:hypothetical protein
MGIDLRSGQRSVTQQFLNAPQVRTALQQVSGGGMTKPVWTQIGHPGDRAKPVMNHLAGGAWIQATAARAEQQRWPAVDGHQSWSAAGLPAADSRDGRVA